MHEALMCGHLKWNSKIYLVFQSKIYLYYNMLKEIFRSGLLKMPADGGIPYTLLKASEQIFVSLYITATT